MAKRYEDRYGRSGHRRDRESAEDRGYMDRVGDEVRSWFGDDDAERRRDMDERRDREREYSETNRRDLTRGGWDPRNENRRDWPRTDRDDRSDWNRSESRESEWDRRPAERQASWRSDEDRGRDDDWSRTYRSSRPPSSAGMWSTDEGRMEFGSSTGVGSTVAGEQHWGRGPKGYQRSDTRIHEEVCDRLTYSDVDAENVEVSVNNGEVTLSGSVRGRWDKRRAEDIAEEVSGVRDVHNSIRVARPDRGIGQSESSASDQPGTMLGVNPTVEANPANRRR